MIGTEGTGNIREIVVAEAELPAVGEVGWDIRFQKLLTNRPGRGFQPTFVSVVWIVRGRIRRMPHSGAVCAGKSSEVVVE